MKFSRSQLSAFAILLSFVTSSVLGRVVSTEGISPEPWKVALHSPCDLPQGTSQLPFEEKEKELEDKSDADTNPEVAPDTHVIICDFEQGFHFAEKIPFNNSLFTQTSVTRVLNSSPHFILDGALLI